MITGAVADAAALFYSRRTGRSDGHPVRGWPFPQRGDGGAGEEYGHTIVRRRSGRGGCLPGGCGSGPGASGPARFHAGGPGRGGRARGPGAGLFGPPGLRFSPAALAHHREPGPGRTPQERDRLRPASGPWPAGGQRADPRGSPAGPGLCRRAFPFRRAPSGARACCPWPSWPGSWVSLPSSCRRTTAPRRLWSGTWRSTRPRIFPSAWPFCWGGKSSKPGSPCPRLRRMPSCPAWTLPRSAASRARGVRWKWRPPVGTTCS